MFYLVKHNFSVSQPRRIDPVFGANNEGFMIEGDSEKQAIEYWNNLQPAGKRLNPFYLSIKQIELPR